MFIFEYNLQVQAVPRKFEYPEEIKNVLSKIQVWKLQAIQEGRAADDCEEYPKMMSEAGELQKQQIAVCDSKKVESIQQIIDATKADKDNLHGDATEIGEGLESCKLEEDTQKSLDCLSAAYDDYSKKLSTLSRSSSKLSNTFNRDVSRAENDFERCKVDVVYFYSDVMDDITELIRLCYSGNDVPEYEIPSYPTSK